MKNSSDNKSNNEPNGGLPNICIGCGGVADPQCVNEDGQHLPFCLACEHYSQGGID